MRRFSCWWAWALCLSSSSLGCQPSSTVTIELRSDVPRCEVGFVQLRCAYDWDGVSERSTPQCDVPQVLGSGEPYPLRFLLREEKPNAPLTVVIEGRVAATLPVVLRRTMRFNFARSTVRPLLDVPLSRECLRPTAGCTGTASCVQWRLCEQRGQTCGSDGACRDIDVSESELRESSRDAGEPVTSCPPPLTAADASVDVSSER